MMVLISAENDSKGGDCIMRKTYIIIALCILIIITGCNIGNSTKQDYLMYSNTIFEQLIDAIQNKNEEAITALFSNNVVNSDLDFNEDVTKLISYVDVMGDLEYEPWSRPNTSMEKEYSYFRLEIESTYDFKLGDKSYRLAFIYCDKDTSNSDNEGIISMYIIKAEDDTDLSFAYRGDIIPKNGINIGIKNDLSNIS